MGDSTGSWLLQIRNRFFIIFIFLQQWPQFSVFLSFTTSARHIPVPRPVKQLEAKLDSHFHILLTTLNTQTIQWRRRHCLHHSWSASCILMYCFSYHTFKWVAPNSPVPQPHTWALRPLSHIFLPRRTSPLHILFQFKNPTHLHTVFFFITHASHVQPHNLLSPQSSVVRHSESCGVFWDRFSTHHFAHTVAARM